MRGDKSFNVSYWEAEIQLASYYSIVRYKVAHFHIPERIGVTRRDHYIQCVPKYMSRASNILNHIATLENVITPGPVTTLNNQINIHLTTNDKKWDQLWTENLTAQETQ